MMPLYDFECPDGHKRSAWLSVDDRDEEITCVNDNPKVFGKSVMMLCNLPMRRVLTPPMLHGDNMPGGVTGRSGDGYFEDKHGNRSDPKTTNEIAKRKEWDNHERKQG